MSMIAETGDKISKGVVEGYKKIETGVVVEHPFASGSCFR